MFVLTKYKGVWKKPRMFVTNPTSVSFSIGDGTCQKSKKSSNQPWKKPPLIEKPTHVKNKKFKQNNSKHGHPLDFCSHCKDSVDGFVSIFD